MMSQEPFFNDSQSQLDFLEFPLPEDLLNIPDNDLLLFESQQHDEKMKLADAVQEQGQNEDPPSLTGDFTSVQRQTAHAFQWDQQTENSIEMAAWNRSETYHHSFTYEANSFSSATSCEQTSQIAYFQQDVPAISSAVNQSCSLEVTNEEALESFQCVDENAVIGGRKTFHTMQTPVPECANVQNNMYTPVQNNMQTPRKRSAPNEEHPKSKMRRREVDMDALESEIAYLVLKKSRQGLTPDEEKQLARKRNNLACRKSRETKNAKVLKQEDKLEAYEQLLKVIDRHPAIPEDIKNVIRRIREKIGI